MNDEYDNSKTDREMLEKYVKPYDDGRLERRMKETHKTKDLLTSANRSFLAIGGIGAGKTTQFATLPGNKFLYAFDPGSVASLTHGNIDAVEFLPDLTDLDLSVKTLKAGGGDVRDNKRRKIEPKTYIEWEADFNERYESGFFNQYDWVGFDSITTFSEIVMDRVLHFDNKVGKHPEQQHWTAQMNLIKNVFRILTGGSWRVYACAHEEMIKDDLTGRVHFQIVITGKLRLRVPLMFGHIFAFDAETSRDNKTTYTMQTSKSREHPICRTSIHGLNHVEEVTLDWSKELEGEQGLGRIIKKAGII